jgi:GTP-binding protein
MRHGLFESDRRLQQWLSSMNKSFMVVFTKADKIARGTRKGVVQKFVADGLYSCEMPLITSGETQDGIRELRSVIEKYAK